MRLIERAQLDLLHKEATKSVRLRSHFLMHNTHEEKVQRLLISLVKGSFVEPHYHELPHQWEMFIVIQGCLKICLYNTHGGIIETFLVGENTGISIVEFSPGDIHSVECVSNNALMMEVKEGPFDSTHAKVFPEW